MNPIHKADSNVRAVRRGRPLKQWAFTCTVCDKTFSGSYYGTNKGQTRKQAKDALHFHMIKDHHGVPR